MKTTEMKPYETPASEVIWMELKELLCESNDFDGGDAGEFEEAEW